VKKNLRRERDHRGSISKRPKEKGGRRKTRGEGPPVLGERAVRTMNRRRLRSTETGTSYRWVIRHLLQRGWRVLREDGIPPLSEKTHCYHVRKGPRGKIHASAPGGGGGGGGGGEILLMEVALDYKGQRGRGERTVHIERFSTKGKPGTETKRGNPGIWPNEESPGQLAKGKSAVSPLGKRKKKGRC